MKEMHETVIENCIWCIGNGRKVNFWLDNWIGERLANKFNIPHIFHNTLTSKVGDWWNGEWIISSNLQTALPSLSSSIAPYKISNEMESDFLAWKINKNCILNMKDSYNFMTSQCTSSSGSIFP